MKTKIKRITALFLAAVIAVSFVACSKDKKAGKTEGENTVYYLGDKDIDYDEVFANPSNSIDAKSIYSSIKYTEKMLYGTYAVKNEKKDVKSVRKNISFSDVTFDNGTFNISALPISVSSGVDYICDKVRNYGYTDYKGITDKEVAVLEFVVTDSEEIGKVPCVYEINGNKVKYTPIDKTSQDGEPIEYTVQDNLCFEYEFSIKGPYLTLSKGDESIELVGYTFTDDNETGDIQLRGYSLENSPLIDNLDYFSVTSENNILNYAADRYGNYYEELAVKLSDDGIATIYLKSRDTEETIVKQFAYILNCSGANYFNSFSIILFDGEKEYYYTDDISMREARQLGDTDIDDEKIKEIAEKKEDLFNDLKTEFEKEGINASINKATGEIALDTTVLFAGDSADVTPQGKEFLNKFLKAYENVVYNEKYDGFISKTMIEGHVAPVGKTTYEGGMPLSEQRAENVKKYCLSNESGINNTEFAKTLETKGYSQSKPVYNSDGEVDYEASRRVSFRFIVNVDK